MRPSHFRFDAAHCSLGDTKLSGNVTLKVRVVSNGSNLRDCKFTRPTPLTTICSSVSDFISVIVSGRIPSKIGESIILTISVIVAPFFFVWSRAYKGRQNQCVNAKKFRLIIAPQQRKWSGIALKSCDFLKSLGFDRPYPAKIRNFIYSLVSGDWLPMLHIQDGGIFALRGQ
ncbi:MAG TPA: hypothetical protein VG892_07810 [Terriglobales bacterium]|nr:hypothetical protein [Terriglobales bacterium]